MLFNGLQWRSGARLCISKAEQWVVYCQKHEGTIYLKSPQRGETLPPSSAKHKKKPSTRGLSVTNWLWELKSSNLELSRRSARTSRTKCLSEAGSSLTSVTRQELRILFCFIYMSLFSCISCFYSYKYGLCLHFLSLLHVCTCTLSNLITWSPEPGRSPVGVTGTGDWWCGPTAGPTTWAKW